MCCSKEGYCGSTDAYCAEKSVCERDADCGDIQCCSNANACVYESYFCSERDEDDFPPILTPTYGATNAPSYKPSTDYLKAPSLIPTNAPSIEPSTYTSSPSIIPTNWPSASRSSQPSSRSSNLSSSVPTNVPSILPNIIFSDQPSVPPSLYPSLSPTESAAPSSSPVSSSQLKVQLTRQLPGGGTFTGCDVPNKAENTTSIPPNLLPVNVDFHYAINIDANFDFNSSMLKRLEEVMHLHIVANKLDCKVVRRERLRRLMHNRPTAISTLKDDDLKPDAKCDQSQDLEGLRCIIIDGGITIYYDSAITGVEVRNEYLNFAQSSIDDEGIFDGVDGIVNAVFIKSLPGDGTSDVETQTNGNTAGLQTVLTAPQDEGASLSGGIIFIIVFLSILGFFLICIMPISIWYKAHPKHRHQKRRLQDDEDMDRDSNVCLSDYAVEDHTYDSSSVDRGRNRAEGAEFGTTLRRQHSEKSDLTLLRSNTTRSKAALQSTDEYDVNGGEGTPHSCAGGSIKKHEHVCADPSLCLICVSQMRLNDKSAASTRSHVEFKPVFEEENNRDSDDEDAATSSSEIRQEIRSIFQVEDTVYL